MKLGDPGAIYHVMNRRDRSEKISAGDENSEQFLETLRELRMKVKKVTLKE